MGFGEGTREKAEDIEAEPGEGREGPNHSRTIGGGCSHKGQNRLEMAIW